MRFGSTQISALLVVVVTYLPSVLGHPLVPGVDATATGITADNSRGELQSRRVENPVKRRDAQQETFKPLRSTEVTRNGAIYLSMTLGTHLLTAASTITGTPLPPPTSLPSTKTPAGTSMLEDCMVSVEISA